MALAAALVSLAGCDDRWSDYNYRMTVHVGDKAFSTVRHVEVEEGSSIMDSSGRRVDRRTQGEAVILDLNGQTYYALLTPADGSYGNGYYAAYVAEPALVPAIGKPPETDLAKAMRDYQERQPGFDQLADDAATHNAMLEVKGARILPREIPGMPNGHGPTKMTVWPMFVTFRDPADPKTVRAVSPEEIVVTAITIEFTKDDVTTGIEKRLGWLPDYYDKMLDGQRLNNSTDLANNLTPRAFRSEIK